MERVNNTYTKEEVLAIFTIEGEIKRAYGRGEFRTYLGNLRKLFANLPDAQTILTSESILELERLSERTKRREKIENEDFQMAALSIFDLLNKDAKATSQ